MQDAPGQTPAIWGSARDVYPHAGLLYPAVKSDFPEYRWTVKGLPRVISKQAFCTQGDGPVARGRPGERAGWADGTGRRDAVSRFSAREWDAASVRRPLRTRHPVSASECGMWRPDVPGCGRRIPFLPTSMGYGVPKVLAADTASRFGESFRDAVSDRRPFRTQHLIPRSHSGMRRPTMPRCGIKAPRRSATTAAGPASRRRPAACAPARRASEHRAS